MFGQKGRLRAGFAFWQNMPILKSLIFWPNSKAISVAILVINADFEEFSVWLNTKAIIIIII